MEYSTHEIKTDGHIAVREVDEDGRHHRYVITPNEPVEKYNDQIEADPDFDKYRTQENAYAYEQRLKEAEPTEEERAEQENRRQKQEEKRQIREELKSTPIPSTPAKMKDRIEKLEKLIL